MRVVEILAAEPNNIGGQQSFILYTLRNMDLSDMKVDLYTPYFSERTELTDFIESNGGEVYAAQLPYNGGSGKGALKDALMTFLKDRHYDVAHIHSGSTIALAYSAQAAAKSGIKKVIVHSHSSGANENLKHMLVKAYAAPIFRKYVTDYCACSEEAARWKFPSSVMNTVHIINNGIDVNHFAFDSDKRSAMRDRYGIDDNNIVLGNVGRFTSEKNQIFLVEVLKAYLDRHPEAAVKLVLLGEGECKQEVIRKAEEYKLTDHLLLPDEYNKVRDYLQMYDIFLFPSLYEGLGIAAVEAQAAGLPVIASTGVPATMQLTENVAFLPIDNPADWCDKIDDFTRCRRTDQSTDIKDAGFDIKDTAEKVRELYFA